MEFKRRFGRQRAKKPQKGLLLIGLLILVLYLWYHAESLMERLFG